MIKHITASAIVFIISISIFVSAQTAISTSFETAENYNVGTVHNLHGWKLTSGSAVISTNTSSVYEGMQGLVMQATNSNMQLEHIAFASNAAALGLGLEVFVQFYIKMHTLPTANFAISGYDLGTNNHRSFMLEFQPNSKIKIYDGSSGWVTQPSYNIDTWIRISIKINNHNGTYQVAINGQAIDKLFVFREIRNAVTTFDYHSVRFSSSTNTLNAAIDKLYVGTQSFNDIVFSGSQSIYNLNITQPQHGEITVSPQKTNFLLNEEVTLAISIPDDYEFLGWTGDVNGNESPLKIKVSKNMSIGANVISKNSTASIRRVANVTQLKEALNTILPGDSIIVASGNYNIGSLKISRSGTNIRPIVIKSESLHGARITGKTALTLSYQNFVTYEGFDFDLEPVSTIFKMEGCSFIRITRNKFRMQKLTETQSSKWITIGDIWENAICNSRHNRIDHNLFEGKYDAGAWLVIDGSHGSVPDISKHDRIDHNIFRNNTPRVANEKETIRIGVSDLSMLSSYTIIERNLFENCDGDPEIVSIKSCNNIVRNNTFRRCLGTLSLRHGNNSIVEGNYFFGEGKTAMYDGNLIGCGGIRVYGMNHSIINNYFEGLTGSKWDAAFTLTNGDVTNTSSSLSSHFLPENIIFAFNTLVNNVSDIEIGFDNNGKYRRAPKNCKIDNNIVVANQNPIIKSFSSTSLAGVSFNNNIMYSTGTSTLGLTGTNETQIKTIDPQLVKTKCRTYNSNCNYETPFETYKLTATSPAINASIGYETVLFDAEGQSKMGVRDMGADEFNHDHEITNGPISELHAGPTAPETYVYETNVSTSVRVLPANKISISPNPFTGKTQVTLETVTNNPITIKLFNATGQLVSTETILQKSGFYQHEIELKQTGLFFCIIEINQEKHSIKLISK